MRLRAAPGAALTVIIAATEPAGPMNVNGGQGQRCGLERGALLLTFFGGLILRWLPLSAQQSLEEGDGGLPSPRPFEKDALTDSPSAA